MRKLLTTIVALVALMMVGSVESKAQTPRPEYPRPQFERADWVNLNGTWTYAFDFGRTGGERGWNEKQSFDNTITVPFCPESKLSGVEHTDFINSIWYQRTINIPAGWGGKKIFLNFGAVDYLIKPFDFARFQLAMDKFERKKSGIVSKKSVEQDDIDSIFFDYATKSDKIKSVLDKGMSEKTYTTILDAIKSINAPTTAEELGDRLGISRVSVRRYLEFMETQGILEMKPVYGKKGRPQHLFKYVQEGN